MGRTGTKWGPGGNGKVGGAARDSRLPPYFTRLSAPECRKQIETGYDDDDHDHDGYGGGRDGGDCCEHC